MGEMGKRKDTLTPEALRRVMLGLLGDPIQAKIAKDTSSLLKSHVKERPVFPTLLPTTRRLCPQPLSLLGRPPTERFPRGPGFSCGQHGHFARDCLCARPYPIRKFFCRR